ncbi:hypothetical protein [Mycolicibacterium fortuitum]|uniref:hypothetical protein n=1 Tax=Mycolicibacterium fortuitum TaxID=1766 RepID=UPI0009C0D956|nr:hypothetical protein [Mycolicibacterium fortuitum]
MRFIREAEKAAYDQWDKLSKALQGMETRVLYLTPDGGRYDLYGGPNEGRQGVWLAEEFGGEHHWPFELLKSEGAYEMGTTIERVNILERTISLNVIVGGHKRGPMNKFQYRMAESRWWDGQDENRDGWLGIYTRYSGWRWVRVRPAKTVEGDQKRDPVAMDNNTATWPVQWIAQKPYYAKPSVFETWKNNSEIHGALGDILGFVETVGIQLGVSAKKLYTVGEGVITLPNRGDLESFPQFIVSAPGKAWVEDGNSGRMVELPYLTAADGYTLVDTDPTQRTLTASNDPVDNIFYKIARQSKILDFLLWELDETGLPVWKRFDKRFMASVPPRTMAQIRVRHSNPNGSITAIMPQRYKRSR